MFTLLDKGRGARGRAGARGEERGEGARGKGGEGRGATRARWAKSERRDTYSEAGTYGLVSQ